MRCWQVLAVDPVRKDEYPVFTSGAFLVYWALLVFWLWPGKNWPDRRRIVRSSPAPIRAAKPPTSVGVPGYRPFFVVALFFAVLHLGVLVLGRVSLPQSLSSTWLA